MWPFKKKPNPIAVLRDEEGNIIKAKQLKRKPESVWDAMAMLRDD